MSFKEEHYELPQGQKPASQRLLTISDLVEFKQQLITDIAKLLRGQATVPEKKWMKSLEVRKLLNISRGTLQNLRVNGTLPYTRIGGVIYYDYEDIQNMIAAHKVGI